MPLYDYLCQDCGQASEMLVFGDEKVVCPACGGARMQRRLSPTSSLTGKTAQFMPRPGDTTCCGSAPGAGGCAGPGSCCGKA
ncbi:regulatory protein, FmdB family [Desulfarculus baarsii DSM 2075]|uniref:Regulatory protein, FmdB family n=1 Tax=Desulfarculus baarsii (strain ATCC 33931 / DSM 2075 / LMG 7858 / VKM B-1802 / 2st14) TaxID=644282 RepID=E1QK76_DESB2|nr:FmdB family zinc ribbon protein [Desulfarculus baarsii]ADK85969.1 regulatory protein, FmdB family [Desulfarculus baarsii DSM 2075]